jgi:hypothetical protein
MAHRMACEHADTLASIASFAGTTYLDPGDCLPTEPVSVLHIHGSSDGAVNYSGGQFGPEDPYPGAIETVEQWAAKNSCEITEYTVAQNLDLVSYLPGEDTFVTHYPDSCDAYGSAELWTIVGGTHSMRFSESFSRHVLEFFYAHPGSGYAIDIDIEPDANINLINLKSRKGIPVAILGSDTFDVFEVNVATMAFGPAGTIGAAPTHDEGGHLTDVNDDGYTDLLSHYRPMETGISTGDTEACVMGETFSGMPFEACDKILAVRQSNNNCGLGFELGLLLPGLMWLRQRKKLN